jgi:hypothetical protein
MGSGGEKTVPLELLHGAAHGRPLCRHEVSQHRMRKRNRQQHPASVNPTEPIREVPQQEVEPSWESTKLDERQPQRQGTRAPQQPAQQAIDQLRLPARPLGEAPIEDSKMGWLEDSPARARRDHRVVLVPYLPGPQEIAWTEELDAVSACELNAADHKPGQDKQAETGDANVRFPRAGLDGHGEDARSRCPAHGNGFCEIRIMLE